LQKKATLGRPTLYDWDDLIDKSLSEGEEHDYASGENFDCTPVSFAALVRRTARVRNLTCAVSVDGDHVYFCFFKEPAA
jgi:hypothetical protein